MSLQVGEILAGSAPVEGPKYPPKKQINYDKDHPRMSYARDALTYKPMTEDEQKHYKQALTDAHHITRSNVR